jgi:hypothetical protein
MLMLALVPSSDSHVFEPPDLWQTRAIGRRGSSGSTAATTSSSRRISSSPGSV